MIWLIFGGVFVVPSVLTVICGFRWESTNPTRRRNTHRGNR